MRKTRIISFILAFTLALLMIPSMPVIASPEDPAVVAPMGDSRYIDFNDDWQFHLVTRKMTSQLVSSTSNYKNIGMNDIDPDYLTDDVIKNSYDDSEWRTVNLPHDWAIEGQKVSDGNRANGYLEGGLGWYRKSFVVPAEYNNANKISIEFDGIFQNSIVYLNGEKICHYPNGYTGFAVDLSGTGKLVYGGTNVIAVKVQCAAPGSRWYTGAGINRPVRLVLTGKTNFVRHSVIYNSPELQTTYGADGSATLDVKARIHTLESNCIVAIKTTVMDGATAVASHTSDTVPMNAGNSIDITDTLKVPNVKLWTLKDPYRYNIVTELLCEPDGSAEGAVVTDKMETKFGFRYFVIDRDEGFYLNGVYAKLYGVCLHTDSGALGTAASYDALKRQMEIMKSMGVNSLRTSHNPPAKEMIDVCSELGIIVMEEAYDGWGRTKATYDFGLFFLEEIPPEFKGESIAWTTMPDQRYDGNKNLWSDWVIQEMVYRDINEPSVVMWSSGNELSGVVTSGVNAKPSWYNWEDYKLPGDPDPVAPTQGVDISFNEYTEGLRLRNDTKVADPNRYAVHGSDRIRAGEQYGNDPARRTPEQYHLSRVLDGYGVNYGLGGVLDKLHADVPVTFWFDAETSSQTGARGVYFETELPNTSPSYTPGSTGTSSMDNQFSNWTAPNEYVIKKDRDRKFVTGQYVWSGFDYIGEPTPFSLYPVGVSSFGIVDTAGFPKDSFYIYQSQWGDKDKPMAHIMPANWNDWYEGQLVEIWCNTNAFQAELFLNGESLGVQKFTKKTTTWGAEYYETSEPTKDGGGNGYPGTPNTGPINPGGYVSPNGEFGKLHLTWQVPYKEGTLEVVAMDEEGEVVARDVLKTAGRAHTITMKPNKEYIEPDGRSLLYVECDIVDANGTILPSAGNLVKFDVEGNGMIVGVDNGKPESSELYKWGNVEKNTHSERSAFSGKVLVIIQSEKGAGDIKLTATSDGLLPTVLTIGTAPGTEPSVTHPELGTVASVERKQVRVAEGAGTVLPRDVKVTYSSGITLLQKVTWEAVDDSEFESPGVFTVKGVSAEPSAEFEAYIDITVASASERVNLGLNTSAGARDTVSSTGPLATASFTGGTGNVPNNMLNGNTSNAWMNTNSTSQTVVLAAYNASRKYDYVATYWPKDVTFDEVNLFFTTSGNSRLPESLNVQYWDGFAWADATSQEIVWQTATNTATVITFDQVTASKVRVVMKNATPHVTAGVMQITQFRTYGDVPDLSGMVVLSFDANGGTGAMGDILADPGASITLNAPAFKAPRGKEFKEWNTLEDGEGDAYLVGEKYEMPEEGGMLFAIWQDIEGWEPISVAVEPDEVALPKGWAWAFIAIVSGSDSPSQDVTWSIEGSLAAGTSISADGVLTVADDEEAPEITVIATSVEDDTKSGKAVVTVLSHAEVPVFGSNLPLALSLEEGAQLTLSVSASVDGEGELQYQWYKGAVPIPGANAPTFTIASVSTGDSGIYLCFVTNTQDGYYSVKVSSNACAVTVTAKPVVQPPSGGGSSAPAIPPEEVPLEPQPFKVELDKSGTKGYISGYTDNSVKPRGNITRYETAVMFYNLVLDENKEAFEGATIQFSDVEEGKWYSDAVELLSAAGILMGYEDGTFRGDATISRAEFATIASRFTGLLLDGELPFSDVPDGHWAYDYILTAYNKDWITGYTDGTFGPGKMIIRAEAFAITNRILGWTSPSTRSSVVVPIDLAGGEWFYNDVILAMNGK